MSFDVACSTEHAFTVWTSRINAWWPSDHTVTGQDDLVIVLEAGPGGRIYERTPEGIEHVWGEVTVWRPPTDLAYHWHLGRERVHATEVEVHFLDLGDGTTRVEIEHRGWEQLGDSAGEWRTRNQAGWQTLLPHVQAAMAQGGR
jgi:beta-lactamase superfamily II metal-dependent hydrolase